MNNKEELDFALSFMSEYPKAAVKILEQSDIDAVASLLSNAPSSYISPVLKYMLPDFFVRVCNSMGAEKAAAVLSNLDANAIAIVLRRSTKESRKKILEELPANIRKNTELLLEFPINTVGAWMSPHMLVVPHDVKNKNVMKYLKSGGVQDDSEYIYITDRDSRFLGRTRFLDLVKGGENLPVTSFMQDNCPSLPAQIFLEQTSEHIVWEFSDVLPVTNRDNKLLGILPHHALRQGLAQINKVRPKIKSGKDPLSSIFEVYGQSLLALFNTVSDAVDVEHK